MVIVAEPEGRHAFANVSFAGFVGSVTGMNAKHIAIGEMGGGGQFFWAGEHMSFLVRRGLGEASSLDEALNVLMRHQFPGNARELENAIEHAFVLCQSGLIELRHLPQEILESTGPPSMRFRPGATLQSIEAMHIADALRRHDGNRKAASNELGIHPTTLRRKIKALGIEAPAHDGRSKRKRH